MAKLVLNDLNSLTNEQSAIAVINSNNAAIEAAMEKTLSRDGTTPNVLTADLDMNSNDILNINVLDVASLTVNDQDINALIETIVGLDSFYVGAYPTNPTTRINGDPLSIGDLYYNTVSLDMLVWNGAVWAIISSSTAPDGSITTIKLADNSVTLAKMTDNSVGSDEIINGSVGTLELADDAVTSAKLDEDAVTTVHIADEAVTEAKIDPALVLDFNLVNTDGPRIPVGYYSATQVQIVGVTGVAMGGFRYKGRQKIGRARWVPLPDPTNLSGGFRHRIDLGNGTSTAGMLFSENWHAKQCWYAQFAASNPGDAVATLGSMPFLRVGGSPSMTGATSGVLAFITSGENQRSIVSKTHQFTTNGLVGCDVLVITEYIDGRDNAWSGRMTTVLANTQTTIELADVGTLGAYDYILVAPPGFSEYCYLNACYMDTAEVRNIADTGTIVGSRGADNTQASISGVISPYVKMPFDGHISPLAVAVSISQTDTLTTATGDLVMRWGMDEGNHDTHDFYYYKTESVSSARVNIFNNIPFSFGPQLVFYSGGALNIAGTSRSAGVRGYLEL